MFLFMSVNKRRIIEECILRLKDILLEKKKYKKRHKKKKKKQSIGFPSSGIYYMNMASSGDSSDSGGDGGDGGGGGE